MVRVMVYDVGGVPVEAVLATMAADPPALLA